MADDLRSADARREKRPFQFTLRTMFLVTFVTALFCSAATTFKGDARLLAISALAWATASVFYWKRGVDKGIFVIHLSGPLIGAVIFGLVTWEQGGRGWFCANAQEILTPSFFVSTLVSVVVALPFRGRR